MTPPVLAPRPARQPRRGFTLVELMITLAIAAVLLAIAVPSMRDFIARKRVEGVAQELATDLRYLRSMQIQRNEVVTIRFGSTATTTCYILYAPGRWAGDCDCTRTDQPLCTQDPLGPATELKTVILARSSGITVAAVPDRLHLLGGNGLPANGTTLQASVVGTPGGAVRVSTNPAMRPELCSVSGHQSTMTACAP